jgi:hypothetical protein
MRDPLTRRKVFVDPTYPVAIDPDITESIVTENDDGYEQSSTWYNTIVSLGDVVIYFLNPGFRFQSVAASITCDLANLKVTQISHTALGGQGTIYGYDTDDSVTWSSSNPKPTTAAKTSASTNWPASTVDDAKTFDVTTIIQEIFDRPGWAEGSLSLFALQNAASANHSQFADYPTAGFATLEIDYTTGGAGPPKICHAFFGLVAG